MSGGPSDKTRLLEAFAALRRDVLSDEGPQISTMRNYRFAIVQYAPALEFELRAEVQKLTEDLVAGGWHVLSIDLHALLLARLRGMGEDWLRRVAEMEVRMESNGRGRGLNYLRGKVMREIEGPNGIAADCAALVRAHVERHPDTADRTLVLIGRAGALYPFFRTSALLRHIDGKTGQVPVVLLYPGTREGLTGLSFMGQLAPDADYRPRIYP